MRLLRGMLALAALLGPLTAQAAAGQVLFALGRVEIQRGGQAFVAQRGTTVEVGDTIATGPTGLTQVRLKDGALLSLRYGSAMVVQEFRLPEPVATSGPVPAVAVAPGATTAGGRSVLRLLRGAFRTVTGLIGRNVNDAYSVVTPVATIGIRGTDYSAAYCSGDCGTTPDGLYVGVSNGEIELTNDSGTLVLANDQYGYVKDTSTPPDQMLEPPAVLETPIEQGGEGDESDASRDGETTAAAEEGAAPDAGFGDQARSDQSAEVGDARPEGDYELRPGSTGSYAYAGGGIKGANDNGVYTGDNGALVGFFDGDFVTIGTAKNFDQDFNPDTGLRWGRWQGGVASRGDSPIDLRTASLHWIYAPDSGAAVQVITGSRSYTLVGNTNPTDSNGAVGFLGDATLFADFTNQRVDSTLSVGFGDVAGGTGVLWQAQGSGSMIAGSALFQGGYTFDAVTCANCGVTVTDAGGTRSGSGGFGGFFTPGAAAAGLIFELTDGTTLVNGAVAFKANTGTPASALGAP